MKVQSQFYYYYFAGNILISSSCSHKTCCCFTITGFYVVDFFCQQNIVFQSCLLQFFSCAFVMLLAIFICFRFCNSACDCLFLHCLAFYLHFFMLSSKNKQKKKAPESAMQMQLVKMLVFYTVLVVVLAFEVWQRQQKYFVVSDHTPKRFLATQIP